MPNSDSNPGMEDTAVYMQQYSHIFLNRIPPVRLSKLESEDPAQFFQRPEIKKRVRNGEEIILVLARLPVMPYIKIGQV